MSPQTKYKDYYEFVFTLTTGRTFKRYGNETDIKTVFGDWPDTIPSALIDFRFDYPASLPFTLRRDLIETIEVFRVIDWGNDD